MIIRTPVVVSQVASPTTKILKPYGSVKFGTTQDRIQYQLMMAAAKKRKLDDVLVWRYDSTGRPALCPLDPGTGQCYEGISEYGY